MQAPTRRPGGALIVAEAQAHGEQLWREHEHRYCSRRRQVPRALRIAAEVVEGVVLVVLCGIGLLAVLGMAVVASVVMVGGLTW